MKNVITTAFEAGSDAIREELTLALEEERRQKEASQKRESEERRQKEEAQQRESSALKRIAELEAQLKKSGNRRDG